MCNNCMIIKIMFYISITFNKEKIRKNNFLHKKKKNNENYIKYI